MRPADPSAQPLRVAFVLHVMQVAGAEVLVAELIQRLGRKISPVVLCIDDVGPLGERLQQQGTPVIGLGRKPGLNLKVARQLACEFRTRDIELVHAHQYTPFFYSALARVIARQPLHLMFTEHGRHYPDHVSLKRKWSNRTVLSSLADSVNAVCEFSAASLREQDGFNRSPVEVIPNGIEVRELVTHKERLELRRRLNLDASKRYIICVARFHPVKDHATLLRAFAIVAAARADTDLLLAGDGSERRVIEALAVSLGVGDRVRFLGVRRDVPALLSASDVFALTSVSEASSLTLLDAMATALPVVVTNVGGNPEIVTHEANGLLAERGDSDGVARALLDILSEPSKASRLGRAARAFVLDQHQLSGTVEQYYQRYAAGVRRLQTGCRDAA